MQVVSKTEFAVLTGVTPTRVGQWIKEGKITAEALEGEGRFARIKVDLAKQQINARRDPGQAFGNGLDTRLEAGVAAPAVAERPADPVTEQIKGERLRTLQFANERAAEERLAARGRYVLAEHTQGGMTHLAQTMLNVFEGGLGDMAQAAAAKFSVPARDVLHLLRTEFRAIRAKAAAAARREAEGLPTLVEDFVPDATDPAAGEA